ncbi:hypothetical protein DMA11_01435 [Marinilabiliaceae bacterium JC017]|nr:hypothetical protein DMA11_01435 [Marinilabiliaceae bacterium JC017]
MKYLITSLLVFVLSFQCYATKNDCKWTKRKHPDTFHAIKEWCLRENPNNKENQAYWMQKQCNAFRAIAQKWTANETEDRKIITHALLRWGWLKGDKFPNTPEIINYYLVYMEYRQKTEK